MTDDLYIFIALALVGAFFIGAVLGWVAFFRVRQLEKDVYLLKQQSRALAPEAKTAFDYKAQTSTPADSSSPPRTDEPQPRQPQSAEPQLRTIQSRAIQSEKGNEPSPEGPGLSQQPETAVDNPEQDNRQKKATTQKFPAGWQANWMIWLGGLCIALAGIFMVRYSIEQGLLGPGARIALALITGLGFHGVAEWLHRRQGPHPSFAALAGGASITLFGALLAALHLYQLLPANLVFVLLALVSLATMALALRQGPVVAAIGLLGAYLVPILVSTGSGNLVAALVYALIISASGLMLLRYVHRDWLWNGVVVGILVWWGLSLDHHNADQARGLYLAAACYLILTVRNFNWLLKAPLTENKQLNLSLLALVAAWAVSAGQISPLGLTLWQWAPLVIAISLAQLSSPVGRALPWLSLLMIIAAIIDAQLDLARGAHTLSLQPMSDAGINQLLIFSLQMAVLYSALAIFRLTRSGFDHAWCSLAALSPLAWLALTYVLTENFSTSWQWSLGTLVLGLGYAFYGGIRLKRQSDDLSILWLIIASHGAYSLAVAMYFEEAGLTLALAAQLISLSWLHRRYQLPWMHWIIKAVLALVVARLSINPWLATYPNDSHWTLWTYGGATLCCFIASYFSRHHKEMEAWLKAASIHLLVLTLGTEVRYWLYDGNVFAHPLTLKEVAINCSLWGGMGLSYYLRGYVSSHLQTLYNIASGILVILSAAAYGLAVTLFNPLWAGDQTQSQIGATPVFNLLLLAYGTPVIIAYLIYRYYSPATRKFAALVASLGGFLFISLEVRHLWQEGSMNIANTTGNGELYTYSAVWLLLAVAALVTSTLRQSKALNHGGMVLLALVIAKIFLVDMAGLEGLLRVASFMGLGISLLGLAYLRSRLQAVALNSANSAP